MNMVIIVALHPFVCVHLVDIFLAIVIRGHSATLCCYLVCDLDGALFAATRGACSVWPWTMADHRSAGLAVDHR